MKVLIFGVSGMLGHKLYQILGSRFDVSGAMRGDFSSIEAYGIFDPARIFESIEVTDAAKVESTIAVFRPDVVVNAVGVIKQLPSSKDVETTLSVNSIFPHRLADLSTKYGFRLVSVSTDCVFKGDRGNYTEEDTPDSVDLYGQSKHWGEVTEGNCLTLRTSIIGRELATSHSLIDWFISENGERVKGFRRAIYSGLPTVTFAGIVADIISEHTDLAGLYHLSSDPIDKFQLLEMVKDKAGLDIDIEPDDEFVIDRSLNSDRFKDATGFRPPSWEHLIDEIFTDPTDYRSFRHSS
jgi:dTDP-4-dehydrorhamnose reductase